MNLRLLLFLPLIGGGIVSTHVFFKRLREGIPFRTAMKAQRLAVLVCALIVFAVVFLFITVGLSTEATLLGIVVFGGYLFNVYVYFATRKFFASKGQ